MEAPCLKIPLWVDLSLRHDMFHSAVRFRGQIRSIGTPPLRRSNLSPVVEKRNGIPSSCVCVCVCVCYRQGVFKEDWVTL